MDLQDFKYRYFNLSMLNRSLICIMLGLIPIAFVYAPKYASLDDAQKYVAQNFNLAKEKLKLAKQHQATLPQLQASVRLREQRLQQMNKYLPESTPLDEILHVFASTAREEGVLLTEFLPGAENIPEKNAKYAQRTVTLRVLGGFQDIATFFDRILHLDRVIHMTDIVLNGVPVSSGQLETKAESETVAEIQGSAKVLIFRSLTDREITNGQIEAPAVASKSGIN